MNYLTLPKTKEEALDVLKQAVATRDKMGGATFWNIVNEDCCEIARQCVKLGWSRDEVRPILGEGTFV